MLHCFGCHVQPMTRDSATPAPMLNKQMCTHGELTLGARTHQCLCGASELV
jgi:hypothetical protein